MTRGQKGCSAAARSEKQLATCKQPQLQLLRGRTVPVGTGPAGAGTLRWHWLVQGPQRASPRAHPKALRTPVPRPPRTQARKHGSLQVARPLTLSALSSKRLSRGRARGRQQRGHTTTVQGGRAGEARPSPSRGSCPGELWWPRSAWCRRTGDRPSLWTGGRVAT